MSHYNLELVVILISEDVIYVRKSCVICAIHGMISQILTLSDI